MVFGIASWRGLEVSYTDGMCRGCTIRFRRQWNLPELTDEPSWVPGFMRGAVTVAVAMALIVTVRASDSHRSPVTVTPPPQIALLPTPVEAEPPAHAAPAPRPLRPAGIDSRSVAASAKTTVAARPVIPEPGLSFDEMDTEPFVLVSADDPDADAIDSGRGSVSKPRFPRRSMFAALPHAGLTQQTP